MSERTMDRVRVYAAGVLLLTALAAALLAAAPLRAQQVDELTVPRLHVGIQAQYARPVGEFRDYVQHGGGLNANAAWMFGPSGALGLRADAGFIVYGSETREYCFTSCRIRFDLTTTNTIAHFGIGPQFALPSGPVRPYASAGVGFAYFATTSSIEGTNDNSPFANSTNFDDATLSWNAGGGLLIPVSSGRTPVSLDLGVAYHGNGEVEYLKKGDIEDHPDGSITFTPTRSNANLLTFRLGVSIGVRSEQR
jgi:opacity protein-like surface antigen